MMGVVMMPGVVPRMVTRMVLVRRLREGSIGHKQNHTGCD
jgi:hypothetical protein